MQRQTVIEIGEHIGNLLTIPNVPCHAWSACTDMLKSQVGEKWKQGKVTAGLEGDQKSFYSWKPGYWTSICIDISQSERKLYVNGQLGNCYSYKNNIQFFFRVYLCFTKDGH